MSISVRSSHLSSPWILVGRIVWSENISFRFRNMWVWILVLPFTSSWIRDKFLFFVFKYLFIWLLRVLVEAHGIFVAPHRIFSCSMWDLVPWPGIECGAPALGARTLSHWTTREVRGQVNWSSWSFGFSLPNGDNISTYFKGSLWALDEV